MVTLKEMRDSLNELIEKGYGDKKVYISSDDEWNYAHEYSDEYMVESADDICELAWHPISKEEATNIIILG